MSSLLVRANRARISTLAEADELDVCWKKLQRVFMSKVAIVAEKMNHHPTWTNTWNTVSFELSTHDAGDIVTDKDRRLASAIDEVEK